FVRQAEALLGHVHAQHARQTNRRTTSALDLRIKRFDFLMQLAPRRGLVDLCKKAVAPRQLLLVGVLEIGEALLHDRQAGWVTRNYLRCAAAPERSAANKSVLP